MTMKFASGGVITTPEGGTVDSVPAYLSPGEYIIRPSDAWRTASEKLSEIGTSMKATFEGIAKAFGVQAGILSDDGLWYDQDGYPEPPPPD